MANYKDSVKLFAKNYKGKDGMFGASVLLARQFKKPKEKVLDDLLDVRTKMMKRKKKK